MPLNLAPPSNQQWRYLVYFAAFGLLLRTCAGPPAVVPPPASRDVEHVPAHWMVDTTRNVGTVAVKEALIPVEPLEGQETRPDRCWKRAAEHIRGGCWVKLAMPPPCEPGSFRYGEACYNPQARSPDMPVSVGR